MLPPVSEPQRVVALARCHRRRRAAAAAAWHPFQVPGVARWEEGGVLRGRPHSELVHVPFAHHNGPLAVQLLDHSGVVGGHKPLQHPRRACGCDAAGTHVVLHLHGDAGQRRALSPGYGFVCFLRLLQGGLARDGDKRSDPCLHLPDPAQGGQGQLPGGDPTAVDKLASLVNGEVVESVRHQSSTRLHAEEVAFTPGSVGKGVLRGERVGRLVLAHHVLQGCGVAGGGDVGGVHPVKRLEVLQDVGKLVAKALHVFLAQPQAAEERHVLHFVRAQSG